MNKRLRIHPGVLKLGLVSFLTDLSSEMIFSVFAVFFTAIAGASSALLGIVEGLADFSASALDYVAGWLSDRTGKHKRLALAGYGFSTAAKVIPLVASSLTALGGFRVIERLGKSFRGPPRDAWLAVIAAREIRGYSFGVHKALDKAGAVLGPLVAYGLLSSWGEKPSTFRMLFWIALVPAMLSLVLLGLIQDQPDSSLGRGGIGHKHDGFLTAWRTLSPGFKRYLAAAGIFSLAYFSFGFLILRAQTEGFSIADTVLLYALFNTCFVASAPLAGRLGDRVGRTLVVASSYLIYCFMSLGFAFATTKWQIVLLFVMYGVFYSIDDAQSKAFVADLEPDRRATAIGVYNFVTGVIYVPASLIAGALWSTHPRLVFAGATCLSLAAIIALAILRPARARATGQDVNG